MDLSTTPPWELDKFIEDNLLGDTAFITEIREDISSISVFLEETCFQGATHHMRVSRVVMGGFYNQYTVLKGRSKADLVVFFNNLTSFEDQLRHQEMFIEEIRKQLCKLQRKKKFNVKIKVLSSRQPDSRSLRFKLSYPQFQQKVTFDVQPAYDVLDEVRKKEEFDCEIYNKIYTQLIRECTTLKKEGEFANCFVVLQQEFLWNRPPELKNLILLVKHWYQLCQEEVRYQLPPLYAVELLTVYAWENEISENLGVQTARGFQSVLELIIKFKKLRVYWTLYYDVLHQEVNDYLRTKVQKDRPLILDPADPTRNVAGSDIGAWECLEARALEWLTFSCFRHMDETPVGSWEVPPEKPGCVFL